MILKRRLIQLLLFGAAIVIVPDPALAAGGSGWFTAVVKCENEAEENLAGTAIFLQEGQVFSLILYGPGSEAGFTLIRAESEAGTPAIGIHKVGPDQEIQSAFIREAAGAVTVSEADVGELVIEQFGVGQMSGSLNFSWVGETGRNCGLESVFGARPGDRSDVPGISEEDEPIGDEPIGDEPEEVSGTCADKLRSGTWSFTAGTLTVGGVFTPLGGGTVPATVQLQADGSIVVNELSSGSRVVFEPHDGSFGPFKNSVYKATQLPPEFDEGIYWYLHCASPTKMFSTTGIEVSHRRGGPAHEQYHQWSFVKD